MRRAIPLAVRLSCAAVVLLVVWGADWSRAAVRDPARILLLGPQGVLIASRILGSRIAFPVWLLVVVLAIGVAHIETGLALWARRPDSRVGLLLVIAGMLWLAQGLRRSSNPLAFTTGLALTNSPNPVLLQLALSVPEGHLRGRRDKAVSVAFYAYSVLANVGGWLVVDPRRVLGGPTPRNLLVVRDDPEAWARLQPLLTGLALTVGALLAALLIVRYTRGSALYRRAFAPIWVAGLAKVAGNVTWSFSFLWPGVWAYAPFLLGSGLVPAMAALSVARSRPKEQTMSEVVSLMGQSVPNVPELRELLRRTTGDASLEVLSRDTATGEFSATDGSVLDLTSHRAGRAVTLLYRHGRPVGALVHDSALADGPEVLRAVEQLAGLVLDNEQLLSAVNHHLEEVQRSRRRIVQAGDAERLRIERNMHDAVQQRLVAAALMLRRADRDIPVQDAAELLRQGADQVETALAELRDVVHGLNPRVVGGGLIGALESLYERATIPVRFESNVGDHPLPESIAVTTYYVVAEALTNVAKHSQAEVVDVKVKVRTSESAQPILQITIRDDGEGGAHFVVGGGVMGLRDRVDAFGGSLDVVSSPGRGTLITAVLPVHEGSVDSADAKAATKSEGTATEESWQS